jgi:hypothetical protein
MKQYPANTGFVNRGYNDISPFSELQDVTIVKGSLSSRAGWETLGALPADIDVFEVLEISGDFYEILVDTNRELYVFKNSNLVLNRTLRTYTGGRLSFSNLGNVVALWDKDQVVSMTAPPSDLNPKEGFIVVSKTVDYNTTINIKTPTEKIKVEIGDPTVLGYAVVDGRRGVDAVARAIATGLGGSSYGDPAEVIDAALLAASNFWDSLLESPKDKNTGWWTQFTTLSVAYTTAAEDYGNLDSRTLEQRTLESDYWLSLIPAKYTDILAVNITGNPTYTPGMDYTIRINADTLTASAEKTLILSLLDDVDLYTANAAAALVAPDNTAITLAYNTAVENIATFLQTAATTPQAGYVHHYPAATVIQTMMGSYAKSAATFVAGYSGSRNYAYKGNVVYIPDITGFSVTSGNDYLTLIEGKVLNPLELPRYAPLGTVLRIEPIPGKGPATFAKAVPKSKSNSTSFLIESTWEESADPGQAYTWDQSTLPTLIDINPSVHVWNLSSDISPYWTEKKAGDIDLCPNPFIVGNKIVDIARAANRLLLLGSNASLTISELGKRTNLFRVSTLLLYPTDAFSTSISGEKPAHLYKIAHWGSHIAILGSTNLFKFDLSNSIDATFPKMTRGVGWGGKQALTATTEADLILVGEEMYSLSYGQYGVRVELIPLSARVNLPQTLLKVLYDTIRKNVYLISADSIWVGHFIKDNDWAWTTLTVPGTITNAWMETQYLRLSCTNTGSKGALLRLPLYPNATLSEADTYQATDTITWAGFWSASAIGSGQTQPSVGARAGLTLTLAPDTPLLTTVVPTMTLQGSEVPGVGRARINRCVLKTRGVCSVTASGNTFTNTTLRATSGQTSRDISIPVNFAGSLGDIELGLVSGEISGIALEYIQGKANLGAAF